jgi:hypothetical protein
MGSGRSTGQFSSGSDTAAGSAAAGGCLKALGMALSVVLAAVGIWS